MTRLVIVRGESYHERSGRKVRSQLAAVRSLGEWFDARARDGLRWFRGLVTLVRAKADCISSSTPHPHGGDAGIHAGRCRCI